MCCDGWRARRRAYRGSTDSIGAFFADANPGLVDDVIAQAAEIEDTGLERYAAQEEITLESAFQTLVTGLAVRYYKAVAGEPPR